MQVDKSSPLLMVTLLFTIVIEVMGLGLVFPILPELFLSEQSVFLAGGTSEFIRLLMYGVAMATWALGIFFGTPYIGDLSDKIGRKLTILICLAMTAVNYGLSAISIEMQWVSLFLISRAMIGFFGGSFAIVQAVIADISPPELKLRNMSWVSLAASVGLVFGPVITIITSSSAFDHWGSEAPFWVACVLSTFNTLSVYVLMSETYTPQVGVKLSLSKAFSAFLDIFRDKRTRLLAIVFFLLQLGWGYYIEGMPMLLERYFDQESYVIGWFFALFGAGFAVSVLVLQPRLSKILSLKELYIFGASVTCIAMYIGIYVGTYNIQWWVVPFSCAAELMCYTSMLTLFSNAVTEHEQGKVMGGTGAAIGAAFLINSLTIAPIYNVWPLGVIFFAATAFLLSMVGVIFCMSNNK